MRELAAPNAEARRKAPCVTVLVHAMVLLCALVLSCGLAVLTPHGTARAETAPADLSGAEIPYSGDTVVFCKRDLSSMFGMFSNPSGDMSTTYKDGKVRISFTPKNQTVFMGFYLNTSIKDIAAAEKKAKSKRVTYPVEGLSDENWIGAKGKKGTFTYDFELDESYCGYAWPIAPIEEPERENSTTREQYYITVPPLEKIPGADAEEAEKAAAVEAVRQAIAVLPSDPKTLQRDVGNEDVAKAAAAYLELSDELRARLTDDERMHLARCAIVVLPSDAFAVSNKTKEPISRAQEIYGSLSKGQQASLDEEDVSSSRSYGRYLENAVWALDSLREINNITALKEGTYTGQVKSSSNMGKSTSRRAFPFSVKSVKVKDGHATAIIEHASNSSQTMRIGGKEYKNLQTDAAENSRFEVPINLNSTFHFAVKGKNATAGTDAIAYEMTVSADEAAMKPDDPTAPDGNDAEAAQAVVKLIEELPSASAIARADAGTLIAYQAQVQAAREAYDKLADAQKSLVGKEKLAILESAEAAIQAATGKGGSGGSSSSSGSGDSNDSGGSGATRTSTTGTAGNLSALVTNSGAQKTTTSSSSSSRSSSSSASSATASSSKATSADDVASGNDSAAMGGSSDVNMREVSLSDSASPLSASNVDLTPAVVGVAMLLVSVGALLFALRFVRRESRLA